MKQALRSIVLALAVVGGALVAHAYADNPAEATLTVTPEATIDLTFTGGAAYDFGPVDVGVNSSTISVTALTLHNNGNVSVSVAKHLQSATGGWSNGGTPAQDVFSLYVATATATAQPLKGDFVAGNHLLANGAGAADALKNIDGSSSPMLPGADYKLWFRLDMPTTITQQGQKTIKVDFTAAPN